MRKMSKNNFKNNVHDALLRIPSEENDIDSPALMTKFPENSASFAKYMIVNLTELNLFLSIYFS